MKKLFIFVFILISTFVYAEKDLGLERQARQLDFDISDLIVDSQESLLENGYKTSSIAWTGTYRLLYHSPARFSVNLVKGQKYVFYTMTTGPGVKICIERKSGFYGCRSSQKSKRIYKFISAWDGEVYYRIQPLAEKSGLHVSYFTKINKEMK